MTAGRLRVVTRPGPDGAAVLAVAGEVDAANVAELEAALRSPADGKRLVVDLSDLDYLDSAGVAALFDRADEGGLEIVARPGSVIASVLKVTRLGEVTTVRLA
jgi:anti-sigma B factor antagonist